MHTKMYVFLKQNYMFWDPAGEVWPRKEALRNARRAFPRAVVFVAHSSRLESPKDLPKPAPGVPRCSRVLPQDGPRPSRDRLLPGLRAAGSAEIPRRRPQNESGNPQGRCHGRPRRPNAHPCREKRGSWGWVAGRVAGWPTSAGLGRLWQVVVGGSRFRATRPLAGGGQLRPASFGHKRTSKLQSGSATGLRKYKLADLKMLPHCSKKSAR